MPRSTAAAKDLRAVKVTSVILVLALGVGYGGLHAARLAEASRIQVAKKRAALEVEIHRLEEITAAQKRQLGELEAVRRESPWSVTAAERRSPKRPNKWAVSARDAHMIRMTLAAYRAGLGNKYRAFYQALGLTPAEIDAFEVSLTGHAETIFDLQAVAVADGLDESAPEIAALTKQADEELRAEQAALLGDAGYRQLQQFNRAEPIHGFLDTVALHTGFPPEPLTETQAQQLAVVLQNASSSYQNRGPADPAMIDWSAVLAPAQGILSANQWDGFKLSMYQTELDQFRSQFFQGERGLK